MNHIVLHAIAQSVISGTGSGSAATSATTTTATTVTCDALTNNNGFGGGALAPGVGNLQRIFAQKDLFTDSPSWCIIVEFIQAIIFIALDFFFVLAVIMILYGSIIYITANGETSKTDNGKKTIFWAVASIVIIAFARVIVTLVDNYIRDARP